MVPDLIMLIPGGDSGYFYGHIKGMKFCVDIYIALRYYNSIEVRYIAIIYKEVQ